MTANCLIQCDICQRILLLLQTDPATIGFARNHIQLGTSREVLRSRCREHPEFVARALGVDLRTSDVTDIQVLGMAHYDYIQVSGQKTTSSSFLPEYYESGELRVLDSRNTSAFSCRGRLVHASWVDFSLLKRWMEGCCKLHGDRCSEWPFADRMYGARPTWVIDVWQQCLVRPPSNSPYMALSYVWGGTPTFKTLRHNVEALQRPGALREGKAEGPVPRTIRDAMCLVERLGERYLWVDALCIVQDDAAQKHTDINNMGAIYANAAVTIVALGGRDAESGLPGLRGISAPRSVRQAVHPLSRGTRVVESRGISKGWNLDYSTYETRGWTYQEFFLARRKIVFEHGWVRWECNTATHREVGAPRLLREAGVHAMVQGRIPNLDLLCRALGAYNGRDLTFPEDAMDGISGILTILSRSFHGGFVSGLPVACFPIAMLWDPMTTLERRKAKVLTKKTCLPSWSWVGWKGRLEISRWLIASDFVKSSAHRGGKRSTESVEPLVQWRWLKERHGLGSATGETWGGYKDIYHNARDGIQCPAGWTQHGFEPEEQRLHLKDGWPPELDNIPRCFYTHSSEPDSTFWYPIPLPDDSGPGISHASASFVSCTTRRAWLQAGEEFAPLYRRGGTVIALRDEWGRWAGALRLQDGDRRPPLPEENNGDSRPGLELVEVAKGRTPSDAREHSETQVLDEWDHEERPKAHPYYEYYYVLWIEWADGVAYRKALGRVEKDVWEAQDRESIELTLG